MDATMNEVKVKNFPIRMTPKFNDLVTKAAESTKTTKHDWIVKAIAEKLEREMAV